MKFIKKKHIFLIFFLNQDDGKIIKLVDLLGNNNLVQISQWKVCNEPIEEIKIKQVSYFFKIETFFFFNFNFNFRDSLCI